MAALLDSPKLGRIAAWRARRLTKARTRERLAVGLERTIADAEAPPHWLSSAIPVHRVAVLSLRSELQAIAERLRAPEPVYAQGVALAKDLLSDSGSPLYQVRADLRAAVGRIAAALDGDFG
jgi:hypothetical protein